MTAIDIYAMTNPALCSLILWSYLDGYLKEDENGCELPLIYIPIPIILSRSLLTTFEGTNKKTGFIEWINRNPDLSPKAFQIIKNSKRLTIAGTHVAIKQNLITLTSSCRLAPARKSLPNQAQIKNNEELKNFLMLSGRLGAWIGQIRSAKIVLHCLGITL